MKILIHDFAGHPFQVALSRELANRGHVVTHAYFAEDPGPKGDMQNYRSDTGAVYMRPLSVGRQYSKGNFFSRLLLDLRYRCVLAGAIQAETFDIVLSSNTPTWVQAAHYQLLTKLVRLLSIGVRTFTLSLLAPSSGKS